MKTPANSSGSTLTTANPGEGGENNRLINPELWQACAGPLVNLPAAGTHVVYFPQGHSEQVAASMKKNVDAQIPSYPNLQSKLLCILRNITLHADTETDEVYAQMTLQPVPSFDKEALLRSDLLMKADKPQTEFFCKTLTASDTSTHGGFSVPRRAAEKIFPPLDFSMQPPAQELVAKDLHDNVWTFRHIYRGQPKRHLLTTGWSLFVGGKRLSAGDSVLFIRDEKQQLLLGIRRANRQPANLSSSVLSSDSMHIGLLAAAAHAAANNSPFTVFYNPRASPSEFVIPLAKYYKAVCSNQISLGMRFRMTFETEESSTRRYMGTITGITDLDPVRWKNSQWRNLQVGWDESTVGDRRNRVSIWEIEPVTAPFFICPTPPFYQSKRPRQGMSGNESADLDNLLKRTMPWLGQDMSMKDPGLSLVQWMNMQQSSSLPNPIHPNYLNPLAGSVFGGPDLSRQLGLSTPQMLTQFNNQWSTSLDQATANPLAMMMHPQQQLTDLTHQSARQNLINQTLPQSQLQSQNVIQLQSNLPVSQSQQKTSLTSQFPDQKLQIPENQIQILQKLHQQQQMQHNPQDQQKPLLDVSQSFSRSISTGQITSLSQQMPINNIQANLGFSHVSQPPKLHHHQQELQMPNGGSLLTRTAGGGGQSGITDEVPSCSTSPSTNNCPKMAPTIINGRSYGSTAISSEDIIQASANLMNTGGFETMSGNVNFSKDLQQKGVSNPKIQNQQAFLAPQTYLHNVTGPQIDYLDSSSSGTSVCISQADVHLQHQNSNQPSFNSQPIPFQDTIPDDPTFGSGIAKGTMKSVKDFENVIGSRGLISSYENPTKDTQPEHSSSMVSQSFGVPDMTFNSIDSTINDTSLLNSGVWAPPPQQFQRMRTYTKVYKRGAVGRSIDITAYSGYDELKQDLARRFGIEGQLEDGQRIGWKLVYVDHEKDVLLVGDDPWEEFVNCVRCIKILSPQEVQQMSLDGDFSVLPNQNHACSSSDV